MPENLIEQLHLIEKDADRIIGGAEAEAARIDSEADTRIKEREVEMEGKYQEKATEIKAGIEEERSAEEKELRRRAEAALEQVRSLDVKGSTELISKIVERITAS